ncbi:hypothetical protein [Salinicola endophyticus]|uniref:DUF3311 domain-containing protein n=1 Tax=Salinicola endophyticus TaxID=1949083 RepID=A0AB74UI72_9GAMM
MKHFVVRPRSAAGWGLLLLFLGLIGMGLWPVVAGVNRARLAFGLPWLALWAYAIVAGCWVAMLLGNRWLARRGRGDE